MFAGKCVLKDIVFLTGINMALIGFGMVLWLRIVQSNQSLKMETCSPVRNFFNFHVNVIDHKI